MIFTISHVNNRLTRRNAKYKTMRLLGVRSYQNSLYINFFQTSQKLLIESYFEMSLATGVNIVAISRNDDEFKEFFKGFGNWLNSITFFIFCILLPLFTFYYHIRITRNQHMFSKKPEVKEEFANFIDSLHCKSLYSSVFGVLYLYRRLLTAMILVFFSDYPGLQILSLLAMALIVIGYIANHAP
jgi:hypothetical protein